MSKQLPLQILTLLIYLSIIIPGSSPSISHFNNNTLITAIVARLPLTILLILTCLHGNAQDRARYGFKRPILFDLASIPVLTGLTIGMSLLLSPQNSFAVEINSFSGLWLILSLALTVATLEELYFRSLLLSVLTDAGCSRWLAVLISAILFAIIHSWQGFEAILLGLISSVLYSCFFFHLRNIFPVIAAHFLHNTVALLLAATGCIS